MSQDISHAPLMNLGACIGSKKASNQTQGPVMKTVVVAILLTTSFLSWAESKPLNHVPYLKPGAPVYVTSPESIQLEPYTEQQVTIELAAFGKGTLHVLPKPQAGISVAEDQEVSFALEDNRNPQITLTLAAQEAGEYRLMFHARLDEDSKERFRVFGVAVYVGEQTSALSQKAHPKHIILPAKETIR